MRLDSLRAAPPAALAAFTIQFAALAVDPIQFAAIAVDPSDFALPGTWNLKETRAGNLCMAQAQFSSDGRVALKSPCVDPGYGEWTLDADRETFCWALDYEKSRVFYSATQMKALPGGQVQARGVIRAAPRADPDNLRQIGSFDAKGRGD